MYKMLPNSLAALKLLAKLHLSQNNLSSARDYAKIAYNHEPGNFESALIFAYVLHMEGQQVRSRSVLRRVFRAW